MRLIHIHLFLMSSVFLLSFIAGLIAKFLRKKNWWLNIHKLLNQIKILLLIIGFSFGFYIVSISGMKHFSNIHGILGLTAFILMLIQSTFGFIITNNLLNKKLSKFNINKAFRFIHKKAGIFVIIIVFLNLFIGLSKIF
ncbi:MAG: hypothetical protein N3A58_03370 [Spirochaetes bacterium]|nr:hypothetical protein [Spirochaetota bacterium]